MKKFNKGLVLEVENDSLIVLTPDGRFLKQKFEGQVPQIGSEIQLELQGSTFNWKRWSFLSIAALLVLILIPFSLLNSENAFAYLTVDINPSIEMGVNKEGKVIETYAFNNDGKILLENINIINRSVQDAIELITQEAIKEKYISSSKENTILISYSDEVIKDLELEETVNKVINKNKQKAVIKAFKVNKETRNNARKLGLSTGKYSLILEAQNKGIKISPEEVKNKNLFKVIREAGGNPDQLILSLENKSKLKDKKLKIQKKNNKFKEPKENKNGKKNKVPPQPNHKKENLNNENGKKNKILPQLREKNKPQPNEKKEKEDNKNNQKGNKEENKNKNGKKNKEPEQGSKKGINENDGGKNKKGKKNIKNKRGHDE